MCVEKKLENRIQIATLDITRADVTCIVNAANSTLLGGGGVDGAIHRAAGPELLAECRTLHGCPTGEAKITKGYRLKADYVIHTVGPIYSGSASDPRMLRRCYWNSLELAKKEGIHSIAFPAISTGVYGYPLKAATVVALRTVVDWLLIHPDYEMDVLFSCFDDYTTEVYQAIWSQMEKKMPDDVITYENDGRLEKAIQYAMNCHQGGVRKGTTKPYILHPMEAVQILSSMNADTHLLMAGILHDTVEDTQATLLDIYELFGVDIAELVGGHTEDKRKSWEERKLNAINYAANAGKRHQMLILADKLANIRSMYADYKCHGDELWKRFNAPREKQTWYYKNMKESLKALAGYVETEDAYAEFAKLCDAVFGDVEVNG